MNRSLTDRSEKRSKFTFAEQANLCKYYLIIVKCASSVSNIPVKHTMLTDGQLVTVVFTVRAQLCKP